MAGHYADRSGLNARSYQAGSGFRNKITHPFRETETRGAGSSVRVSEAIVCSQSECGQDLLQLNGTFDVSFAREKVAYVGREEEEELAKQCPAIAGMKKLTKFVKDAPRLGSDLLHFWWPGPGNAGFAGLGREELLYRGVQHIGSCSVAM
jgi:hypothetical protein